MPPENLHLLIKPASGACNMRCGYCFYASLAEGGAPSGQIMTPQTAELVIARAAETGARRICFAFQGGEPTLAGLPWFRRFTELAAARLPAGTRVEYHLQTNGLAINQEWAEFLAAHGFLVGLSVDGTREIHDRLRPDAAGKGTYGRVLTAARTLMAAGVETNALCVVSALSARHGAALYNGLKKAGFRHLQFIPCVEDFGGSPLPPLTAEGYLTFLRAIFPLWYRDLREGNYVSVRYFDNLVHMVSGREPEACGMQGYCPGQLIVESDGRVYPCDFYVLPELVCGDLAKQTLAEIVSSPVRQKFCRESLEPHPDCPGCPVAVLCRGGCRRDRQTDPALPPGKNRYCGAYRQFLSEVLPALCDIRDHMQ
ncbi:MAG: SPASM domain-containing protein [Clostridia bacterium]|nr:SPASM domain-containing protein [Clostridia bacterium]